MELTPFEAPLQNRKRLTAQRVMLSGNADMLDVSGIQPLSMLAGVWRAMNGGRSC